MKPKISAISYLKSHRQTAALLLALLIALGIAAVRWILPPLQERSLQGMSLEQLQQLSSSQPRNGRAFYYLGVRRQGLNQVTEARDAFKQAALDNPDDEQAWLAWVDADAKLGSDKEEFTTLRKFADAHPDSANVHKALARFYTRHWAFDEAYGEASMAARLAPQDVDAWLLAGGRAMDVGQVPKAEAAFRQAVKLAPNDWHNLLSLAVVLQTEKHYDDALTYYQKAYALAPNEPGTVLAMGGILLTHGSTAADQQRALQLLQQAVSMNPDSPPGLRLLGQAYLQAGQYQKARDTLQHAVELSPEDATLHFHLQQAYLRLGDNAAAAREAKKHTELVTFLVAKQRLQDQLHVSPNDLDTGLKYARICAAHGDLLDAVLEYRRLLLAHPEATAVRSEFAELEKKLPQASPRSQ
ncbi:MAG TPA: tetratricopeptide repeat protein [Capsulimonadaceae bacterium]|nr:tetratricopeptide repeat protein [Capsulimonadaceae bacterium]